MVKKKFFNRLTKFHLAAAVAVLLVFVVFGISQAGFLNKVNSSPTPVESATSIATSSATTTSTPKASINPTKAATPAPTPKPTVTAISSKVSFTDLKSYYNISGTNESELRQEMNTKGPKDDGGVIHDANTNWNIAWTFPRKTTSAGCETGGVSVTLRVDIQMPSWSNKDAASADLKAKWDSYLSKLLGHENGHRGFAISRASEVLTELNKVGAQANCNLLDTLTNNKGQDILNQLRADDIKYDQETNHGATQGAIFP